MTASAVRKAITAGLTDFGENRIQEAQTKIPTVNDGRWHLIGHLQRNKARIAIELFDVIQSVDSVRLARTLSSHVADRDGDLSVLVQVNTSGEPSKFGLSPESVPGFLRELSSFDALRPKGFMTLATFTPDEAEVRRCFRVLRGIRDRALNDAPQGAALGELSMGMSGDYRWAVEEGATIVRVGQAVFGARPLPDSHYWPGVAGTR